MAIVKKNKMTEAQQEGSVDSLWRKPITLDSFDDDDPLETLYRGRESGNSETVAETAAQTKAKKSAKSVGAKAVSTMKTSTAAPPNPGKPAASIKPEESKVESAVGEGKSKDSRSPKVSEEELKNILKIKSDSFQFTDVREILRGKSYDIYAYLRFLSGEAGVCKIKHLDLMRELDISRPTLFKQGDWLTRLSLIEKRNVPGDHLGTSYTVYRLEDVLPVSNTLVKQLESHIESFGGEAINKNFESSD
jgi:predicted transcriptional regulator